MKRQKNYLVENGYIPLDKSWVIRMGVLDLLNGYKDAIWFLKQQKQLGDDLKALLRVLLTWESDETINVGESATLYRFLRFASWKLGLRKKFIFCGSLRKRKICDDSEIVNWSLAELLKLDNGTSQWASAAILLGNQEEVTNPPYKLQLTYEAVEHWKQQRIRSRNWIPRYDETILTQATAYLGLLFKEKVVFIPRQAEDYCFARVFGFITRKEGESRWPSLHGHESDRITEIEKALCENERGIKISSEDHRVVQAIAMHQNILNRLIKVQHPSVVKKSWPQFWKFLKDSKKT